MKFLAILICCLIQLALVLCKVTAEEEKCYNMIWDATSSYPGSIKLGSNGNKLATKIRKICSKTDCINAYGRNKTKKGNSCDKKLVYKNGCYNTDVYVNGCFKYIDGYYNELMKEIEGDIDQVTVRGETLRLIPGFPAWAKK